jgi:hypothetical protein
VESEHANIRCDGVNETETLASAAAASLLQCCPDNEAKLVREIPLLSSWSPRIKEDTPRTKLGDNTIFKDE